MQEQTFKAGEYIFREGEESDWAYLIVSGSIDIFKRMENKGTVLLATLGEGEIFGEMGIISDMPRAASAAANTLATVKAISRESFASIVTGQPEEIRQLFRGMMERLRETNQKLTQLASKHAEFSFASHAPVPPVNRVTVVPLTNVLKGQMSKAGMMVNLPFRVGALAAGATPDVFDCNNFFIKDANPAMVSRNHFSIQRGEGGLCVADRGSKLGTIVNGKKIGGGVETFQLDLKPGDNEVIAGDETSEYRFCVTWE